MGVSLRLEQLIRNQWVSNDESQVLHGLLLPAAKGHVILGFHHSIPTDSVSAALALVRHPSFLGGSLERLPRVPPAIYVQLIISVCWISDSTVYIT